MIGLNRKIQPPFQQINKIDILKTENYKMPNSIPVCMINAGTQDVVKLDFVFQAGSWEQDTPLQAMFTNLMLNEGTNKFSSKKIAGIFDFYGALLNLSAEKHSAVLSVVVLNRHVDKILPVIEDILKNSVFPGKEFSTVKQKEKQSFLIDLGKVKTIARNQLSRALFGPDHPYGKTAEADDFDRLDTGQLASFYSRLYHGGNCTIFVAGKINDRTLSGLEKHFGDRGWCRKKNLKNADMLFTGSREKYHHAEKPDAVQSAIRVGRVLFNKLHPDFHGMQVLNTILGGYFGSRLMANIREDKGYTYGIGSAVIPMKHAGLFAIMSEVGAEFSDNTIKEIRYELKRLRTEKIPADELALVRNYMLGEMLSNFDGSFATIEAYKGLYEYGLDNSYFNKAVDTLRTISPGELKRLANEYLHEDSMYYIVAGKRNSK